VRVSVAGGAHAELARQVVLFVLLAELLASAGHDRPPHRPFGPPQAHRPRPQRRHARESLSGRRPRG
jgi:hypothetical protein